MIISRKNGIILLMFKLRDIKIQIIVLVTLVLTVNPGFYYARAEEGVDNLNTQKMERQRKLDQLNLQIRSYTSQIENARNKSNTLKNEVVIYEKQIASTELQIQAKQTQIEDTATLIKELGLQIAQRTKEIEDKRKVLAQLLVELNEYDNDYLLKTTVGSQNLSEFLDQIQYTSNYQDRIYQLVQQIKTIKTKLEQQQKELEIQLKNLTELKAQLELTQNSLELQRNQKQALLNQTKGLEKNFQKLLAVSKDEEDKIQKEIENLDAQIRAKLGTKTVNASKGILAWPMDGILTQKYGNTGFTALGYNFHNGIDVAAPAAQPIYAAAAGTVVYTDSSDAAYGNWVAIKHALKGPKGPVNIITLYGHMRSYKVSPGQKVQAGDLLGYEGNTGNTTKKLYGPERGYHIHFGVYDVEGFSVANGAYGKIYGAYKVPYGYTYNPLDFLGSN